jgi:hypothetical protein
MWVTSAAIFGPTQRPCLHGAEVSGSRGATFQPLNDDSRVFMYPPRRKENRNNRKVKSVVGAPPPHSLCALVAKMPTTELWRVCIDVKRFPLNVTGFSFKQLSLASHSYTSPKQQRLVRAIWTIAGSLTPTATKIQDICQSTCNG